MQSRLGSRDLRTALGHIQRLYSQTDLEGFRAQVISAIADLVPSNFSAYNDLAMTRTTVDTVITPALPARLLEAFVDHMDEHPLAAHYQRTGDIRPNKISDLLSVHRYHALGLYADFFRHIDGEDQIAMAIPISRSRVIGI